MLIVFTLFNEIRVENSLQYSLNMCPYMKYPICFTIRKWLLYFEYVELHEKLSGPVAGNPGGRFVSRPPSVAAPRARSIDAASRRNMHIRGLWGHRTRC
jgi:hypothetical protein